MAERRPARKPEALCRAGEEGDAEVEEVGAAAVAPAAAAAWSAAVVAAVFRSATSEMSLWFVFFVQIPG